MKVMKVFFLSLIFTLTACLTPHGIYHVVKPGQTLYSIARTYDVDLYKLMKINHIKDPTRIKPGDRIFIPGATHQRYVPVTVREGNNINSETNIKTSSPKTSPHKKESLNIKVSVPEINVKVPEINSLSHRSPEEKRTSMSKNSTLNRPSSSVVRQKKEVERKKSKLIALKIPKFIWPVEGTITSRFGWRGHEHHDGIDIAAPAGTPIVAAADGIVLYSSGRLRGYGNMIVIKHTPRVFTIYAHNKKNLVKKGQKVKQGQVIGLVGSTGHTTGPHLHFEIRIGNVPVDPLKYLPPR